tara:strand:- start:22 stop:546 length:525 start_codon:yes stop_codon:yes gene_type:complete
MPHVIYKIICDDVPNYVYVGSTKAFRERKANHKRTCNNPNRPRYGLKIYSIIRENGGWDKWRMVIIHECEDGITTTQARIIEEEFRVKLNGNMNSQKCYLTDEEKIEYEKEYRKEYNLKNKEMIIENKKEHYLKNKEAFNERSKKHYLKNKEAINIRSVENRDKRRQNETKIIK